FSVIPGTYSVEEVNQPGWQPVPAGRLCETVTLSLQDNMSNSTVRMPSGNSNSNSNNAAPPAQGKSGNANAKSSKPSTGAPAKASATNGGVTTIGVSSNPPITFI